MNRPEEPAPSRRSALAALGSGVAAFSGGCLQRTRSLTGWQSSEPVELRIKTLPTDADPYALALARRIAQWFREAGIDASVQPMAEQELLRQCLLRTEFDAFVIRLPARFKQPDALRTLLHSRYADTPGWQNPFGYTDLDVDAELDRQRTVEREAREEALASVQRTVARAQPFTLLTVPDDVRAARTAAKANWGAADLHSPLGYLRLAGGESDDTLRIVSTDGRATTNLSPLSVEFRRNGVFTGLLYDPLVRTIDGERTPWLAESVDFSEGIRPEAEITLRADVRWHDGEPLTAEDVAFTYDLLADTTLDGDDTADVPSPEFRGRSSLVDSTTVVDDRRLELTFVESTVEVAARALTVPVLPEHVWSERTDSAAIGGISVGAVTAALVTNNIPPVGSGPFEFGENAPGERLRLERRADHFSAREGTALPDWVAESSVQTIAVQVVGSDTTAVEMVVDGTNDVTGTAIGAATVPRIGRAEGTDLLVERSDRPYVLGYNTRQPNLDNPQFRQTLGQLVDECTLTEDVLGGYGHPEVGPLNGTPWYPEQLEWDDGNPVVPFLGDGGTLDDDAVRAAFREAGYQYEDDSLVGGSA